MTPITFSWHRQLVNPEHLCSPFHSSLEQQSLTLAQKVSTMALAILFGALATYNVFILAATPLLIGDVILLSAFFLILIGETMFILSQNDDIPLFMRVSIAAFLALIGFGVLFKDFGIVLAGGSTLAVGLLIGGAVAVSVNYLISAFFKEENLYDHFSQDVDRETAELFLKSLDRTYLLNQENLDATMAYAMTYGSFRSLPKALERLQKAGLLTQENFNTLLGSEHPVSLAETFIVLQKAALLTDENRARLIAYPQENLDSLNCALKVLQETGLLTQENFERTENHTAPLLLDCALRGLRNVNLLTQQTFNTAFTFYTPLCWIFLRLPSHLLDAQTVQTVLERCEGPYSIFDITIFAGRLTNQLLGQAQNHENPPHGASDYIKFFAKKAQEAFKALYEDDELVSFLCSEETLEEKRENMEGFDGSVLYPLLRYTQYLALCDPEVPVPSDKKRAYKETKEQLDKVADRRSLIKRLVGSEKKLDEEGEKCFQSICNLASPLAQGNNETLLPIWAALQAEGMSARKRRVDSSPSHQASVVGEGGE